MMRWKHWRFVTSFTWTAMAAQLLAAPETSKPLTTIVAEGTGKDQREARQMAFREAVSRAVGTLIDAETRVENDRIVRDQILEFSNGFVRTYETLEVEQLAGGRVRVRIRATVEQLRLMERLKEAEVPIKEFRGADLAAEKVTRKDGREAATGLLTKLYAEIPKLAKAEVRGKPRLSPDGSGAVVNLSVSVDREAYAAFSKKAATLLDRLATAKDSIALTATTVPGLHGRLRYEPASGLRPRDVFSKPDLGAKTPPGYAVWLATIGENASKLRWNLYWVDAEVPKVADLAVGPKVRLQLLDRFDDLIVGEQIDLSTASFGLGGVLKPWFLNQLVPKSIQSDGVTRQTASLFLAPIWSTLDTESYWPEYQLSLPLTHRVRISDADLERVQKVTATVEFGSPAKPR